MEIEQMRIRMGEMASEIDSLSSENDRLRRELNATDMSWENALAGHKALFMPALKLPPELDRGQNG